MEVNLSDEGQMKVLLTGAPDDVRAALRSPETLLSVMDSLQAQQAEAAKFKGYRATDAEEALTDEEAAWIDRNIPADVQAKIADASARG